MKCPDCGSDMNSGGCSAPGNHRSPVLAEVARLRAEVDTFSARLTDKILNEARIEAERDAALARAEAAEAEVERLVDNLDVAYQLTKQAQADREAAERELSYERQQDAVAVTALRAADAEVARLRSLPPGECCRGAAERGIAIGYEGGWAHGTEAQRTYDRQFYAAAMRVRHGDATAEATLALAPDLPPLVPLPLPVAKEEL